MARQRIRRTTRGGFPVRGSRRARAARLATLRLARERRARRKGLTLFRTLGMALIFTGTMGAVLFVVALIAGLSIWNYFSTDLPELSAVEARQFETTRIYDRNWNLLYEVNDPLTGFRTYRELDDITDDGRNMALVDATTAAEDRTFWSNVGVDPIAILRGIYITFTGDGQSGGSTITQQLVRQLYPDTIGYERSLDRKLREAIVATQFTQAYSKEDILELYFNTIYYGNRAYGIDAAARSYFDKEPADLTLAEAALLAGLPQAPSAYDPTVNLGAAKGRQRYVLDQMVEAGSISRADAEAAWQEVLVIYPRQNDEILAPHWVNYVIGDLEDRLGAELVYRGGLSVRTTLDIDLQHEAERALTEHLDTLEAYNANNGAVVAMLPGTSEIVVMVGSRDYYDDASSGQFNVATSERQPGSAFMPIVYASAFEQGWSPAQVLLDYPVSYLTPGAPSPEFIPQNTTREHYGAVSARAALARSLNVPAVKTLDYAGVGPTIDLAHQLGVRTGLWRGLEFYGLALALGAGEVSPLELTTAYATFANAGRYVAPNAVLEILDREGQPIYELDPQVSENQGQQVTRPATAYLVSDILSDNQARLPAYGRDNILEFPELDGLPVAVKTGTSFDWFDNWTVGYSPDLVLGVWVGNSSNLPLRELDGAVGAAPVFHEIMVAAHGDEYRKTLGGAGGDPPSTAFARPDGLVEIEVCQATGGLARPSDVSMTVIADRNARPAVSCDQLTALEWTDLQGALLALSGDRQQFTEEARLSILAYARAVGGGIGVPDDAREATPTPTGTVESSPTPTPRAQPTARPTSTPPLPPTATPTPTPSVSPTEEDGGPPGSGLVRVPNVGGMTLAQATAAIEERGLELGDVVYITQADLPPGLDITIVEIGQVYFQTPAPSTLVQPATEVSIAIRDS
jgi:membrane peptidoglycan carboxypeptidase